MSRAQKIQEFVAHGGGVTCAHVGKKTGRRLATGGSDKRVNVWRVGSSIPFASLSGLTSEVSCVTMDFEEEMVVGAGSRGMLKIWDIEGEKAVRTYTGPNSVASCVTVHPFGEYIVSGGVAPGSNKPAWHLWDLRKRNSVRAFTGHKGDVLNLRFSPDGRWVASSASDGVVALWDITAGKRLHQFTSVNQAPITCSTFHPTEYMLATGDADGCVQFWDLQSLTTVCETPAPRKRAPVTNVTFTPDGRVALASQPSMVRVWGWQPDAYCHDKVVMRWDEAADVALAGDQMVAASFAHASVALWVVNLDQVAPFCGDENVSVLRAKEREELGMGKRAKKSTADAPRRKTSKKALRARQAKGTDTGAGEKAPTVVTRKRSTPRLPPHAAPPTPNAEAPGIALVKRAAAAPAAAASRAKPSAAAQVPPDVMRQQLNTHHAAIMQLLDARLVHVREVVRLWKKGAHEKVLAQLIKHQDAAVAVDVLRQACKPHAMDLKLDMVPPLAQLSAMLLCNGKLDTHVQCALDTLSVVLTAFRTIISTTLKVKATGRAVDVVFEERRERCAAAQQALAGIVPLLRSVQGTARDAATNLASQISHL